MHVLIYLAAAIASGLFMERMLARFRLPGITGYILAGILIGPGVLGLIPREAIRELAPVGGVAMAFIAFHIGSEMIWEKLRRVGKSAVLIHLGALALSSSMVIVLVQLVFGGPFPLALLLGSLAVLTAPGPVLMIVRQYRSSGPLTDTLIPVVCLDDMAGILLFSVATSVVVGGAGGGGGLPSIGIFVEPLREIGGSLLVGGLLGAFLTVVLGRLGGRLQPVTATIAALLLATGAAASFKLSNVIICFTVAAVVANFRSGISQELAAGLETAGAPVLTAFFTLAGAELDFASLAVMGPLGVCYVLARMAGKIAGGSLGGYLAGAILPVRRNIGFALVPQAGVSIGLAAAAAKMLPAPLGQQVLTVILAGGAIYGIIGPFSVRFALERAGEIAEECSLKKKVF